jgi:hypothetical protein
MLCRATSVPGLLSVFQELGWLQGEPAVLWVLADGMKFFSPFLMPCD